MKTILPWLVIVALAAGAYFQFNAGREKDAELAKLRDENAQLDTLRSENDQLKKIAVLTNELVRLRKDNEDIPRLRGQVRKLTDQTKQLTSQVQGALSERDQAMQQQNTAAQLAAENEALRTQASQAKKQQEGAAVIQQLNACINHMRQIDGAKQQWALENKKSPLDTPTIQDIAPYIKNVAEVFACPGGGTYTINNVQTPPTCTVPGHALQ